MADKKLVLRVREEFDCPLFRVGEQMVLSFPNIERNASANICALAIAKFVREQLPNTPCSEGGVPEPTQSTFLCPREKSPVVFDVFSMEEKVESLPMLGSLSDNLAHAVATLRNVPLFRALPAATLGRLAAEIIVEAHPEGVTVIQKGSLGKAFYIVHSGLLEVIGYADEEVSSVVTRLRTRDCFGELSLLTGGPCAATVVTRSAVTLLKIRKASFDQLLRENPFLASAFTRLLAARLMATNLLLVKEGAKTFSGKLQEVSLSTVLQTLADANRSGTLVVNDYQGGRASFGFNTGRLYRAQLGEASGEAALFAALAWTKGDFSLDRRTVPDVDLIDCGMTPLLLEGMRRLDEGL